MSAPEDEQASEETRPRKRLLTARRGVLAVAVIAGVALIARRWPRPENSRAGRALAKAAPSLPDDLIIDDAGMVDQTIDGDTVELSDGRQVRLVGTQAPKLALGRENFTDWPLSPQSKEKLDDLVGGRRVDLAFGGVRRDRHGRTLAHLVRDDGLWVQGAMLAAGMSRVYTFADNRAGVASMLEFERAARADQLGIWRHPFYAIRSPREAAGLVGGFELVEGEVLNAADARSGTYLNFGRDWSTDFTVFVQRQDRRIFDEDGFDLLALEGRRVRVRGWLVERDGPMIEVSHPEQIEIV